MRRWLWGLLPLAIAGVLVGVFASRFGHNPRFIPSPLVGKPAPTFSLPELYHPKQHIGTASFKGKVVLFNVFASWCVACTQEAHTLKRLSENGVTIYGLDFTDTRPAAKAWLRRWGDPYRAVAFDHNGEQGANWGIWGVPETYVLDRNGKVVRKFTGVITPRIAVKEVLPLVNKLRRAPG